MYKSCQEIIKIFNKLDKKDYLGTYKSIPNLINQIRSGIPKNTSYDERSAILGTLAEQNARVLLEMYADNNGFKLLESTILEYEPNRTTEIDLILITDKVIFLIECKHRSENIILDSEGNFILNDRIESPVSQNVHHINKMLSTLTYGKLLERSSIFNVVFLLFNKSRMDNPITIFKKDGLNGGFAGHGNLLPLIHKIYLETEGNKIPMNTIYKDLIEKSSKYAGKEGMKKHIENVKRGVR